ncbi:MAG TPA: hypothetical protein VK742_01660, partial [Candidatus Sulfotelmatobacter sp.]|nr:hypothetical protein [Candidatus Sulfotelmatobacter sp.]
MKDRHIGSNFDDFLAQENLLAECEAGALKRVVTRQIAEEMKRRRISRTTLAGRMKAPRTAIDPSLPTTTPPSRCNCSNAPRSPWAANSKSNSPDFFGLKHPAASRTSTRPRSCRANAIQDASGISKTIANSPMFWSAAGSETPRRFRPREDLPNVQKPAARSKAVSRLRLATAFQNALRNSGAIANSGASWT